MSNSTPKPPQRDERDAELERELQDHRPPAAVKDDVRGSLGWQWPERLWLDIRLAVRLWARTPGFSAIAIATIGLGIRASTALVGQIKAVFWTPLPVAAPEDLRFVAWTSPRHPYVFGPKVMAGPRLDGTDTLGTVSYSAYLAMRDDASAFADVACWSDLGEARPVILGGLGFGTVQFVSGNYFRALGVRAAIGRTIEPGDQPTPGWSPVAMVSHRFWQRTFGGASDVTSRTLALNGRTFAIVGVMPEAFSGMDPATSPDIVVPSGAIEVAAATPKPLENRGLWNACRVVARLAPGRSDEEARIDLERVLAASIAAAPPSEPYDPPRVVLVPAEFGQSTLRDGTATPLAVLLVVVSGLLLAACANIAGLLLARGSARSREIATRLALGASRGRVVRQLITESLVLSCAGGLFGLMLAYSLAGAGSALLSQFMPTLFGADRALNVAAALDGRLLAFGAGLALLSGLVFGALPAVRATRLELMAVIRDNARAGSPRFGLTAGQAMVAAQTALAVLLLVGAGLFIRTLNNLRVAELGFETAGLLYANIEPRSGGLVQSQRRQFFEDAVARLRAIPGVTAAAATGMAPLGGDASVGVGNFTFGVCRATPGEAAKPDLVPLSGVSPGYFQTMGTPIIGGRDLMAADTGAGGAGRPNPVVVNQAFAQKYFPGQSAVGQTARVGNDCTQPLAAMTVVGVVSDSKTRLRATESPALFLPLGGFQGPVTLIVRTAGDPASMIPTVRRAMTELNANTPTFSEAPVTDLVERHLRQERLLASLLTVFAGVTAFICCLGIYGMLAYAVERRRQEISVRMAIGAQTGDVIRLMVRESLVPVASGIAAGAVLSMAANRWLGQLLYGVSSYDPATLAAASVLFLLPAIAAAALPSRAAARVDPVLALRQ